METDNIKFSIMENKNKNSVYVCIKKDGSILDTSNTKEDWLNISDGKNTYQYLGLLFNAIGNLDKDKLITIIYDMRIPFAFILLILKIKASTKTKFRILINDKDTYDFIQDFINTDPKDTKNFFFKNSDNILKDNKYSNLDTDDTNDTNESSCETGLKKKFKDLKTQLDKDQEILMRNELLKDSDNLDDDLLSKNENIQRQLNTIENISNDDFIDIMENNFTDELRKLNISLF